ncbi:hypothetical protein [Aequorivita sp. CIP111184]|uniref:hypothetical protein n=1 Tax=Aequorivita sp. CIP111184 TaxID=2211356 RepID=UPI000DBC1AB0|nr:hypothetical protein [Aequorivita sp. CIP111184]SRX52631.1 hypothetical protein AEQU1_00498 [Aequorivita sp. CIP111184]
MKNSLYVVPNLNKISGGPITRINLFKKAFQKEGGQIITEENKLKSIFQKRDICYIESATNRIALIDLLPLFFIKFRSKKVIVFIRDIYIELFPEDYSGFRKKITFYLNKFSNFYLTWVSTSMVFPTKEMGEVFFQKNKFFPKRPYSDLPPGTYNITQNIKLPDFSKKLGLLYLGSIDYKNSGFDAFILFAKKYSQNYNFFVLSGATNISEMLQGTTIKASKIPRADIAAFIQNNNIAYALHTRPRNMYDDLTFPIKVFDFLSFQLPFFTEKHIPLENLLSNDYPLFASFENSDQINQKIISIGAPEYKDLLHSLKTIALNNTYDKRYQKLLEQ